MCQLACKVIYLKFQKNEFRTPKINFCAGIESANLKISANDKKIQFDEIFNVNARR